MHLAGNESDALSESFYYILEPEDSDNAEAGSLYLEDLYKVRDFPVPVMFS